MHRARALIVVSTAVAVWLAVALAACGGGSSSNEDPQQALKETFSNDQSITSGNFDLTLSVNASGGSQPGKFDITLGGPFQGGGGFPRFDVNATVKADTSQGTFAFNGGLTSTGTAAFVNFQGTDYSVPSRLFDQFASTFQRLQQRSKSQGQGASLLSRLGIDPSEWLTDLHNEGTTAVEGTDTIHISGSADVPKLLDGLRRLAQSAGPAAQRISPSQIKQIEDAVKTAEFDVYTGANDKLLRKLTANVQIEPPAGATGAPSSVTIDFSLTFTDVNQDQTIEAPANAKPLADLLRQFGVNPKSLGGLTGGLGGALPQAGGSGTAPSSSASQAYLACIQSASGAAELQKCAALLQQ